jgi:dihydrodipicolinate synthase/N-acetylneuraminate lyase
VQSISLDAVVELAGHPKMIGMVDMECETAEIKSLLARTDSVRREVQVTSIFAPITARMTMGDEGSTALVSVEQLAGVADRGGTRFAAASPAVSRMGRTRTRTKTVGYQVLAGSAANMLGGLSASAVGIAPPFAACAPQACYEVLAAWKDGDVALVEEKQTRILAAARLVEENIGLLKFCCDLNGYFGARPRLPLLPPDGPLRAEVEQLLAGLRN